VTTTTLVNQSRTAPVTSSLACTIIQCPTFCSSFTSNLDINSLILDTPLGVADKSLLPQICNTGRLAGSCSGNCAATVGTRNQLASSSFLGSSTNLVLPQNVLSWCDSRIAAHSYRASAKKNNGVPYVHCRISAPIVSLTQKSITNVDCECRPRDWRPRWSRIENSLSHIPITRNIFLMFINPI
jgi:hypothetical protein